MFLQETRRQAAVDAANRRLQQTERRGVDEAELLRLKQRQAQRDRIEKENAKLPKHSNEGGGGLQVSGNVRWLIGLYLSF